MLPVIACLGWGSLIWDPQGLPIVPPWQTNGPALPIEFARVSSKSRLTLTITPGAELVTALWCPFSSIDIGEAAEALRIREGPTRRHWIGVWPARPGYAIDQDGRVGEWARQHGVAGVVWTALPPKFCDTEGRIPSLEEAVQFFRALPAAQRSAAEEYVRNAPSQIDTPIRRKLQQVLGWTTVQDPGAP